MIQGHAINKLFYLVLAYIFLVFGYGVNAKFIHHVQLSALTASWIFLLLPLLKKNFIISNLKVSLLNLLLVANFIGFTIFYLYDQGIYIHSDSIGSGIFFLKFIAFILFFFYLVKFDLEGRNIFSGVILHLAKYKFIYLLVVAFILRLLIIYGSPTPTMDVFWVLDGGADALLAGENSYSAEFFNSYNEGTCLLNYGDTNCENNSYTYLPATLIITTFFKHLFGDVRFAQLFAAFGSALIVYLLTKSKFTRQPEIPELLSLLVLYLPFSLFVLEQSWVDSISLFLLYLFVYLLLRGYKYLPYLIFGSMMAVKQLSWVFFGFILRYKDISIKKYLLSILVFLGILSPFLIWGFSDFVYDTITYVGEYKPSRFSLTFNTISKIHFGRDIPFYFSLPALFALFAFLMVRTKRDIAGIIHSALIFLLGLFLIRQGFPNYYFSITMGIVLLITLETMKLSDESGFEKYDHE